MLSSRRRDSELCWHESALLSSFKSLNPNLSLPCYCSMFSKGRECQLFPILLTDTPWHADSVFIKHRGFLSRAGSLEHTDCGDPCPCTFSRAVTGPRPGSAGCLGTVASRPSFGELAPEGLGRPPMESCSICLQLRWRVCRLVLGKRSSSLKVRSQESWEATVLSAAFGSQRQRPGNTSGPAASVMDLPAQPLALQGMVRAGITRKQAGMLSWLRRAPSHGWFRCSLPRERELSWPR